MNGQLPDSWPYPSLSYNPSVFFERLQCYRDSKQFARGHWTPDLLARCSRRASQDNPLFRLQYLRVHQSMAEPTPDFLDIITAWAHTQSNRDNSTLQTHIASILLSAGRVEAATSLAIEAVEKDHRTITRYPMLLAALPADLKLVSHLRTTRQRATQLVSQTHSLSEWEPLKAARYVAVVGNAPSERGRGNGRLIDQADMVVRFNNVITDQQNAADYGSTTHLWVISPSYKGALWDKPPANNIVVSGYNPWHRATKLWQRLPVGHNQKFFYFPTSIWYDLVKELEAPPSAGLLALKFFVDCQRSEITTIENCSAFGFSDSYDPDSENHYGDRGKRSSRHNWEMEAAVVSTLGKELRSI